MCHERSKDRTLQSTEQRHFSQSFGVMISHHSGVSLTSEGQGKVIQDRGETPVQRAREKQKELDKNICGTRTSGQF